MIDLHDVRAVFGRPDRPDSHVVALDDVSLHVDAGEVLGLVGPSGSGKSTLARCVNLLQRPTSGTVVVDGDELTALGDAGVRLARRRIGMIFQHFNLLDTRTAAANVEHPLQLAGLARVERRRRVSDLLDLVGLSDKHSAYPAQLSGGQKQRVAIARALAAEPAVLLCDEATSALDPGSTASVLGLLRRLRNELGLTILLITHEMDVVKALCDSAVLLEGGHVVDRGRLVDVVARPDSALARQLLPTPSVPSPPSGSTVLEVLTSADAPSDPVLDLLVRRLELDVAVVGGRVETIGGRRFGRLQLQVRAEDHVLDPAVEKLRADGVPVVVTR